jgi:hypothetical protein
MKQPGERPRYYQTLPYRLLTGTLGIALLGGGLYGITAGPLSAVRILVAAALVVLGVNMVWSAWAARESWLSRIGPLP